MARPQVRKRLFVVGVEGVLQSIKGIPKKTADAIFIIGKRATKSIRRRAIGAVRVNTGLLKKSIRVSNSRKKLSFIVRAGGKTAPHAHLVEFGHKTKGGSGSVPAHPFLGPAYEVERGQFTADVLKAVRTGFAP